MDELVAGSDPKPAHTGDSRPSFTVHYQLTSRDYLLNALWLASRSTSSLAIGTFVLLLGAWVLYLTGDISGWFSVAFGLVIVTGVMYVPVYFWALHRRPDLLLAPHELSVGPTGLTFTSSFATTAQSWATYRRVRETPIGFVVDFGMGGGALIPKSAFDASSLAAFRAFAEGAGKLDHTPPWRGTAIGLAIGSGAALIFALVVEATA